MLAPLAARVRISSVVVVVYCEVLILVLSVTPDISLEKLNALHLQEHLNGFGHGFAI